MKPSEFRQSFRYRATVNLTGRDNHFEQASYTEGLVEMVSLRGINIRIPGGTRFVKWCNVIDISRDQNPAGGERG
jgi:hypothetical protein